MTRFFLLLLSFLSVSTYVHAQTPIMRVSGDTSGKEVYLKDLNINVEVTGNIATTSITMTFKNRTNKTLEGELTFPLPEGATVSRYALDINGKMREAVPVDKAKGTQVFEEIERRRVDPGLLEKVEGNNFRTRIYPIMPMATRTVTIGYEQELFMAGNNLRYNLPLGYKENIENFSLSATVWNSNSNPSIDESFSDAIHFDEQGSNYVAKFSRANYAPERSLTISLPKQGNTPEILMQPASGSYYFLVNNYLQPQTVDKQWNDNIGIIWDISLSGLQRDIKKELDILDAIITKKQNLTVRVGFINNTFTAGNVYNIQNGNWKDLRTTLENAIYDGGTNYSAIDLSKIPSGEYILFSDGISSFGSSDFKIKNTIHCIVSSPRSNYSQLKWIALKAGGKFINLNEISTDEAKDMLAHDALQFMGIKNNAAITETYPSIATPIRGGNISVAGISNSSEVAITLLFGIGGKVTQEKTIQLNASKYNNAKVNVHRIWAQKKITEMDIRYEQNKQDIIELGQQFGLVTRGTSLIVLETLQDYITYGINPPEELQDEYARYMQQQKGWNNTPQQQLGASLLAAAKVAAVDLKKWWNTSFTVTAPKYPQPDKKVLSNVNVSSRNIEGIYDERAPIQSAPAASPAPPPPPTRDEAYSRLDADRDGSDVMQEVVVTGFQVQKKVSVTGAISTVRNEALSTALDGRVAGVQVAGGQAAQNASESQDRQRKDSRFFLSQNNSAPQPVITIADIKQDRDYFKTLTGDVKKDYEQYLSLRKNYQETPAYYFDMAQWFSKHKDTATAIKILSSIADLDLENASLFKTLEFRLKEYNDFTDELFVAKKIMEWRPMEPQSYRDYALALSDIGQYQAALDTLNSALTRSYAQNIAATNSGVEEVFVTEINQLIAMYSKKLNIRKIDTALIKAMPVDIRVVLNWNMNDTDIDLHVTDPLNEMCYYSNRRTKAGGRLSTDIRRGYGPEQFMLKKAVKGKYKIEVNYFGDSQVKNAGPSTLMAEIYTNYSDGRQQRKIVCLQMSKDVKSSNGKILVGEFIF